MVVEGTWYPANHAVLTRLLQGEARAPAVFDWDNTCILNDIGDATFRYQLERMALRAPPHEAHELLPTQLGGQSVLHGGFDLAIWGPRLLAAYEALWPAMQAGDAARVQGSAEHLLLRAGLGALYVAIEQTPGLGAQVAYPWLTRWLHHFSQADIEALGWAAWQAAAAEPLGAAAWQCEGLRYAFKTGLVAHREMRSLMQALHTAGFPVFVVTASHEAVVRGVTRQLGVSAQVYGMRPHEPAYPLTYRAGKVQVIRQFLPAPPILVAGDTNTDYDMLTAFPETRVRLVIHRYVAGDIQMLHAAALSGDGRTLLQGRDERTGAFLPQQRSITGQDSA